MLGAIAGPRHPTQENFMKLALISASLAGILSLTAVTQASAWSRSGSVTTRRGTFYGQSSGGCSGGTCSRSRSVTGPNGNTVSRTESVTRTGPNSFGYSRTATGLYGNGVTRSGEIYRY
jgi:hypothetical protein